MEPGFGAAWVAALGAGVGLLAAMRATNATAMEEEAIEMVLDPIMDEKQTTETVMQVIAEGDMVDDTISQHAFAKNSTNTDKDTVTEEERQEEEIYAS